MYRGITLFSTRTGTHPTFAYGQSVINYHSTNGEASVDIVATKGGSSAGSNSAEVSGDFHVLPGSYGVVANASVLLQSACGHSVQATARGRAWNEVFVTGSWITWGLKKDSDTKANSQSACATGTPGGGGGSPPSEPPGDDCHWARDMIIFADGSWMWLNDWYIECGEENQERASPSRPSVEFGKTSARDHAQGTNLRLSLVGTGPLANGRRIAVYRDPQSSADALIAIDTTRANSADLQTALVAAAELSSREIRRGPKDVIGTVIDWPSDRAQRMARPQSIAADYLRQLSWASEKVTKLAGPGRQLDVVVDRRMLGQR